MALDMEDVNTPETPAWWLINLGRRLDDDKPRLELLNQYDIGNHPLPQGHRRAKAAYQKFQRQARTNFTGLVSEAVLDRLQVTGFRMGGSGDLAADNTARSIWQDSYMDADATIVMRDALVMGRAYVVVGPDPSAESKVMLTPEDPRQVIHAPRPDNRREVRAALKTWFDDVANRLYAVVYLPDTITYFTGAPSKGGSIWQAGRWELDTAEGDQGVAANPLRPLVPVVPFINRPEKRRSGFGEFEDVTDVQDRINQHVLDRLVISATQAFRQRWATGSKIEQQFDPGADLLWWVEDDKASFGDFTQTDIRMIVDTIGSDVEHLASVTRTPPYYLLGKMANLSGDALTAAEAGLVAKARRRMAQFGESWEAVQALSFQLIGQEAAIDAETIWADPERRNEAGAADASVKKNSVGVPWRQLMEDLGYTPQQIDRMEVLKAADRMKAALMAPPPPPPVPGQPPSNGQPQNGNQPQPRPANAPAAAAAG